MDFVYRTQHGFLELNPGESGVWRLPPMTAGDIFVDSFYAMPPGWSSGAGSSASSTPRTRHGAPANRGAHGNLDGRLETAPSDGTIHLDQPAFPTHGNIGGLDVEREPGGSTGRTMELTLELLRGGNPMASEINHIAHHTLNSGDIWTLRVSRKQDGSVDRRRYKITSLYPSVLPSEIRRIPMAFFSRGFNENWNENPYLEWIQLRDNVLSYQWNLQFAAMYGRPLDNQHVPLGVDSLKLPDIKAFRLRLLAGGAANPMPGLPNQVRPEAAYFALRIDCEYLGAKTVKLESFGSSITHTLPDDLWFEVRFFLAPSVQGTICYDPRVSSPLLDMLDFNVSYPTLSLETVTVNVKQAIAEAIEKHLYQMQFGPDGNVFDKYLRPWIVGRYEVSDITYDRSADEMVVTYVGRQRPPEASTNRADVVVEGSGDGRPAPEWPRLFVTPFELPLPAPSIGHDGRVARNVNAGALNKIEHIVVLMQENRSFDQVLGYLSREGLLPRDKLLSGDEGGRREVQDNVNGLLSGDNDRDAIRFPDQPGGQVYRSSRTTTTAWPSFGLHGPGHDHASVERQIADGMKGFIADFARNPEHGPIELQLIMNYFTDAELPAYGALTREFAICDGWYCSHIGGTLPNRFISLTGDLNEDVYGSPEVENADLAGGFAPLETPTFFDHLTQRGVSWKLFEHGYSMLRLIRNYTFDQTNIVGFKNEEQGFVATARAGRLPAVSFIEPDYIEAPGGNDDHAPADMMNGQLLIATIVGALLDSPQWEKTLLIITYDEHGGFYDHVPLPFEVSTTVNGSLVTRPIPPLANGERRLSVRVPAFVISPFIRAMPDGKVNVAAGVYDHTTIPATILRRFCAPRPPDLGARMSGSADLRDLLALDTPRPRSEFNALAEEMRQILLRRPAPPTGTVIAAPLRRPAVDKLEEDFSGLIAFASSVTGKGPS
jgi:phospholipase C